MEQSIFKLRPQKNATRNIVTKALVVCLVFGGFLVLYSHFGDGNAEVYNHFGKRSTELVPVNGLQLRPEYPVSDFIYKRGFLWFLGLLGLTTGTGIAIFTLKAACVAAGAPISPAGCALAATAVVTTVIGIAATIKAGIVRHRLHLAQQSMLYMDFVDKSSKKFIDQKLDEISDVPYDEDAAASLLRAKFGDNYKFEGLIDEDDDFNRDLFNTYGGPVPVFSFNTPDGLNFHHAMVPGDKSSFHRFALVHPDRNGLARRQATKYKSAEHFKKGGIDLEDCALSEDRNQRLDQRDHKEMQQQLKCNDPNILNAKELAVQVYDATTKETIGAGKVAPATANGKSDILSNNGCPSGLPTKKGCGKQKGP